MRSFPVWDLLRPVGTAAWEPVSLYWEYRAELTEPGDGFFRLWFHGGDGQVRNLGVFCPENGVPVLRGRISRRALGSEPEEGWFSLWETPWRAMRIPGFSDPAAAMKTETGYRLLFSERDGIPEEAVSRFCFFRRRTAEGRPCLELSVDERGDPLLPQISP